MTWTTNEVWERVDEAFQTFTRLPGEIPAGYSSSMPEHLPDARDVFAIAVDEGGYRPMVATGYRGGAPTGDMIDRAMEVYEWCLDAKLEPGKASWICLWGSCAGYGAGKKICRRLNITRPTKIKYRNKALEAIKNYLNSINTEVAIQCAEKAPQNRFDTTFIHQLTGLP